MTNTILVSLRNELQENSDKNTKASSHRFFKEPILSYGIKTSIVSEINKKYFSKIKHLSKKEIFLLCEDLFKSDYMEEAWIAASWADKVHKQFEISDFAIFEQWVKKYINNWAKCDTLCNHAVGNLIDTYPELVKKLFEWTKSSNRWVKRASAVSLIVPAKEGKFLDEIFKIADALLKDPDDMVQKGYGWLLKEASRKNQKMVYEYVLKNKAIMPRTSLRYAIEKMPTEMKKMAMEK